MIKKLMLFFSVLLVLSACVPQYKVHKHMMYLGKERPLDDVAIVMVVNPIIPYSVDNKNLELKAIGRPKRTVDIIELLPGNHRITVGYYTYRNGTWFSTKAKRKFLMSVKAGHVYTIKNIGGFKFKPVLANQGQVRVSSPDGKRSIYLDKIKEEEEDSYHYVVDNGRTKKKYQLFNYTDQYPIFSPDGKRIAFFIDKDGGYSFIIDGKEGPSFEGINYYAFSPDSKDFYHVVTTDGKYNRILRKNNKTIYQFHTYLNGTPKFSSDNKRFAMGVKRDNKWSYIIDNKISKTYDSVTRPCFSPDSKSLAYGIESNGKWGLVLNGKEQEIKYTGMTSPHFSPNNKRIAFKALIGKKAQFVVDSKESKIYDSVGMIPNPFSPNSKHYAFVAIQNKKWFIVIDGKEGQKHKSLKEKTVSFSKDNKKVKYYASVNDKWEWVEMPVK